MSKKVKRADSNQQVSDVVEKSSSNLPSNNMPTEADKIWQEVKDRKIDMFALPSQVVSQYCKPVTVEPSKLYLIISATSVLPALEAALGTNYVVDRMDKFITVARNTNK